MSQNQQIVRNWNSLQIKCVGYQMSGIWLYHILTHHLLGCVFFLLHISHIHNSWIHTSSSNLFSFSCFHWDTSIHWILECIQLENCANHFPLNQSSTSSDDASHTSLWFLGCLSHFISSLISFIWTRSYQLSLLLVSVFLVHLSYWHKYFLPQMSK